MCFEAGGERLCTESLPPLSSTVFAFLYLFIEATLLWMFSTLVNLYLTDLESTRSYVNHACHRINLTQSNDKSFTSHWL